MRHTMWGIFCHQWMYLRGDKLLRTHHDVHRSWPNLDSSISLDEKVRISLIDHFFELLQDPRRTRSSTDILQWKDSLKDLDHTKFNVILRTTQGGTSDVIWRRSRPTRIDCSRIFNVIGLPKVNMWEDNDSRQVLTLSCALWRLAWTRSPAFNWTDGKPFPCSIVTSTVASPHRVSYCGLRPIDWM